MQWIRFYLIAFVFVFAFLEIDEILKSFKFCEPKNSTLKRGENSFNEKQKQNITKTKKKEKQNNDRYSIFAAKKIYFQISILNKTMLSSFVVRKKSHIIVVVFIRLFTINFGNGNVAVLL